MENFAEILSREYFGNTAQQYLIAAVVFLGSIFVLTVFEKIILARFRAHAEKTDSRFDDFILHIVHKTLLPLFYVASFYFASKQLVLPESVDKLITSFSVIILTIQVVRLALAVLVYFLGKSQFSQGQGARIRASKGMMTILQVVVWGIGVVFILDNLGFNISAIVAGMGIGGVAIALAAQNIVGDLFNYFVIFFDRPFEDGDFIITGDYLGTIEHIGIKTTRIRSLGGEQIVIGNSDLTSSRIRNYKRMQQRRVLFPLGVTYQTSSEKMKQVPEIIKKAIESIEKTRFDRAHFKDFGDFSLNIEVVYYVLGADYNQYMDIQQNINIALLEAFEREGIEFAYPTQTLFMSKTE